ncbi:MULTISPECIES: shikimate dehydrogenase [unclassified Chelatococcus]|uniref:shikimate dehydrogenase n=1 Tax=unclassified Chelatococcus TaxID=2638111 RepID=UPI00031F6A4B|nr:MULTISPECIES: shikimate dehydrogenase [unclassified Chelatococcus]ALA17306.1 shikimate dehydrogenase [Chelatococcus sp. CO-6]
MTDPARPIPKACIIGHPVAHSRSPMVHGFWLRELGLAGDYTREDVRPEDLAGFVASLRERGYVGANVTVPHKEAVLGLADVVSETARAMGAANTLWFENGILHADNTDVPGFLANLDERAPGWDRSGGTATVLGAGGAARAVIYGLLARGFSTIHLVNRNEDRSLALQAAFGPAVKPCGWDRLAAVLPATDLLVNTTSLGMSGQPPLVVDLKALPDTALVHDIVYIPLTTGLLSAARARGLATVDGLGMLLHQAVPGFAHWFGRTPTVTEDLRALLVRDIERAAA